MITGLTDVSLSSNHFIGILFGLGATCLYATVILLNKYIKDVSGIHRTVLQFYAAFIVLLPYVWITSGFTISALTSLGWISLANPWIYIVE